MSRKVRQGRAVAAISAALLLGGVAAADETTDSVIAFIIDGLAARETRCFPDVEDAHQGKRLVCAVYGGRFSAFKSNWDMVLDRFELPAEVEADTVWTLSGGDYHRTYRRDEKMLTVSFSPDDGQLLFVYNYTDEEVPDPSSAAAASGIPSASKPKVAGFGGVTLPQVIEQSRVPPEFPEKAKLAGVVATVTLEAVILADGSVGPVNVISVSEPGYGFEDAATAAVQQWRYEPSQLDGRPVDASHTIRLEFVTDEEDGDES